MNYVKKTQYALILYTKSQFGAIFGPTCMYKKLRNFRNVPPGAKLFFPPQFRTPSTNSFAYSQSETFFFFFFLFSFSFFFFFFFFFPLNLWYEYSWLASSDKSTHVRGLVILLRWGKEEEYVYTQDAYNQIYVQWMATSDCHTSCTVLSFRGPCHWFWTITLVRGKLTLH